MAYPSLYRAKAVSVKSGSVEVFVPQVFGETTITVSEAVGVLPDTPGMGWIFFQAGNCEFPVWMGDLLTGGSDSGGTAHGLPAGGDTGQVLGKQSGSDYDTTWMTASALVSSYRHIQTVPSTVWVIVHALGFHPNASIVDSSGRVVIGEVEYLDVNTIRLTFSAAFGGEAYLS